MRSKGGSTSFRRHDGAAGKDVVIRPRDAPIRTMSTTICVSLGRDKHTAHAIEQMRDQSQITLGLRGTPGGR